jgi:hypothetical protein
MRIQFYVSFISAIYASIKLNTKHFKSNESQGDLERKTRKCKNKLVRALNIALTLIFLSGMAIEKTGGLIHYS